MTNMLLPELTAVADAHSLTTMTTLASTIFWGAVELIISIGFISGYSFLLCYAVGMACGSERSLEAKTEDDSSDDKSDLPDKQQTCALMMTGFLGGIHVMLVFYGIPLFGHDDDSFLMKLLFSCALLAAASTCVIILGVLVYLIVPAIWGCCVSLVRKVRGSPSSFDEEAAVGDEDFAELKKPFLDRVDSCQ